MKANLSVWYFLPIRIAFVLPRSWISHSNQNTWVFCAPSLIKNFFRKIFHEWYTIEIKKVWIFSNAFWTNPRQWFVRNECDFYQSLSVLFFFSSSFCWTSFYGKSNLFLCLQEPQHLIKIFSIVHLKVISQTYTNGSRKGKEKEHCSRFRIISEEFSFYRLQISFTWTLNTLSSTSSFVNCVVESTTELIIFMEMYEFCGCGWNHFRFSREVTSSFVWFFFLSKPQYLRHNMKIRLYLYKWFFHIFFEVSMVFFFLFVVSYSISHLSNVQK